MKVEKKKVAVEYVLTISEDEYRLLHMLVQERRGECGRFSPPVKPYIFWGVDVDKLLRTFDEGR